MGHNGLKVRWEIHSDPRFTVDLTWLWHVKPWTQDFRGHLWVSGTRGCFSLLCYKVGSPWFFDSQSLQVNPNHFHCHVLSWSQVAVSGLRIACFIKSVSSTINPIKCWIFLFWASMCSAPQFDSCGQQFSSQLHVHKHLIIHNIKGLE